MRQLKPALVARVATARAVIVPKTPAIAIELTAGYCMGGLVISVTYIIAPIFSPIELMPCNILKIDTMTAAVIPISA